MRENGGKFLGSAGLGGVEVRKSCGSARGQQVSASRKVATNGSIPARMKVHSFSVIGVGPWRERV